MYFPARDGTASATLLSARPGLQFCIRKDQTLFKRLRRELLVQAPSEAIPAGQELCIQTTSCLLALTPWHWDCHQQATGHGMGELVGCWGCTQVSCLMKHLGVLGGIVASYPRSCIYGSVVWTCGFWPPPWWTLLISHQNFLWCNFVPIAALLDQHPAAASSPAAPHPLCLSRTDPALHCVGVVRRMHIKYKLTGRGCFVRKSSPQHK